jgi:hypothetical protein
MGHKKNSGNELLEQRFIVILLTLVSNLKSNKLDGMHPENKP